MSALTARAPVACVPVACTAVVLGTLAFAPLQAQQASAPAPAPASGGTAPADLAHLFAEGRTLLDRSGDGVVDDLAVRIVVPDDANATETAVAANLAARFGFETSASSLGLVVPASELDRPALPVLLVGSRALSAVDTPFDPEEALAGSAPGEGVVVRLPPSDRFPSGGAALVGHDLTGLLAVGAYVAGRMPEVWALEGDGWTEVTGATADFLGTRGLENPSLTLEALVVDAARPGVARARVAVPLPEGADVDALEAALRGADGDPADDRADAEVGDQASDRAGDQASDSTATAAALSTLHFPDLHRLDVELVTADGVRVVPVRPDEPWDTGADGAWRPDSDTGFGLPELYEVDGFYRDTNRDLVPDEIEAYLSVTSEADPTLVGDFATRIGLEAAGLRAPLAHPARQSEEPGALGLPVAIGADHPWLDRLLDQGDLPGWSTAVGAGTVRMVEGGFAGRDGLVVAGGDAAGTDGAVAWLAARAPYLREHERGGYRLHDARTHARRTLQGRTAGGQASLALHKLDSWMRRLGEHGSMAGAPLPRVVGDSASGGDAPRPAGSPGAPSRIEIELAVETAQEGLDAVAADVVRSHFPDVPVDVSTWSTGFGVGDTVYQRTFDLGWEVEDARGILEERVYPEVGPAVGVGGGGDVSVELRVSEPPEVRADLAAEIRAALAERGAPEAEVVVLNAYKQGYSWLTDEVLPRLRADGLADHATDIRIEYHTLEEADDVRWQTIAAETRWLQELYPVDAVLARELGIDVDRVTFHPVRRPGTIYRVEITDAAGDLLLEDAFHPTWVVRPFFDLFPDYERIRVTTGHLSASVGGETLVDERIVTDLERFWDRLQTDVYGRLIEYVMDIQDGSPSEANAPFFDEFRVDLRLSEPDHRIGVQEEVISSLEAMHEDIYFETLTLFDRIGDRYGVGGLDYPGRILPYIDPTGAGEPGRATVTLTGKERGVPELVVRAFGLEPGERPVPGVEVRDYALSGVALDAPELVGATVRPGARGGAVDGGTVFGELLFAVEVADSVDRWHEYRGRTSEAGVDRSFLSVEFMEGMLAQLRRLHGAGLYGEDLSWDVVERTSLLFRVEDDTTFARIASVPRSPAPRPTTTRTLMAEGWSWDGAPMVQWETPIPPAENDSILARLNTFPGVRVWHAADSYLGQPVWVAEFLPEDAGLERGIVSQAKLNALKPTLFISGRQHANEVSSTSHILRLGELLVTDSAHRAMLDEVNVVLHPILNPDGARLAVEMQETNPDHMLHAGYLGALGVDATSGERSDDPIYPESQVRREVRERWLPDAYVNMHGYPSHEWVQHFAGYSAWVRSRRGGQRDWWSPRGWFIPGFGWVEDEDAPEYTEAQFAMLDSVAASIRAEEDVAAMSDEMYARYRKYGTQDRDAFREYFRSGILVYLSLNPSSDIGQGVYSDRITWFSTTTEAPDETARGDWLDLVASAGLAHSTALLRYLATGESELEREAEAYDGLVTRKVFRVKPVLPREPAGGDDDPDGGG